MARKSGLRMVAREGFHRPKEKSYPCQAIPQKRWTQKGEAKDVTSDPNRT